jgi:hypothetical protein
MTKISRGIILITFLLSGQAFTCGELFAVDKLVVDDFQNYQEGAFPEDWGLKKWYMHACGKAARVLMVRSENGNKYLSADSAGDSCTAGKEFAYNLSDYKFLSWRWRVRMLPKGGSEAGKGTNDSAAGLYICFNGVTRLPYCIKYVWSSSMPVGAVLSSPHRKATKIAVLRSGPAGIGVWTQEKRNVYDDFIKFYGVKNVKDPVAFAILTDSDDTASQAAADYDDIAVSR